MRPIPPYLQHHVRSASSGTCQALPLRTPGSICAASLRYIPLLSTGAKEPAHTLAAATKRVLAEKHAALCGKKQQAYEYNTSCSEPAVHGGARRRSIGRGALHWQLAAQQEGAGENRGRLLEAPAKTRRRKARERAKRLLAAPAKRRGKKKHRGREDRPHPSEERARAGKDSAVAAKHGLSWTPIGKGGNDMRQSP